MAVTNAKKITAGRIGTPMSGTSKVRPAPTYAPGQLHYSSASSSDASALASMNRIRAQQGLAPQTQIGVKAPSRSSSTGPTTVDTKTNSVKDRQGNVLATGSSLSEALAKQTQLSTGSAPSVSGRPDLYAVAPGSNQEVKPYYDASTKTTVTPTTATSAQLGQAASGTLQSFNKAQGLTYLDGKTFKDIQSGLSESDLIRGPNGQIFLKQGLTVDQVKAKQATMVSGTAGGVTGDTLATDFKVDVPDTISTDTIAALTETPVTETDFNRMMAEIQVKQDELLGLMAPGADELATKAQINSIKAQVEKSLTELSMGLNNVEDQPIAMQFIAGQQASIQRSADAKLQNLARIETNLLNELGLEQDARKVKASVAETQLGYLQTNLDVAFKVRDMIQKEEDSVYTRARNLKADAQATLTSILDTMKGMDESDMTADQQKQLQDLAISSGIPYSLVTAGLSNVKKQMKMKTVSEGLPGSAWTKEQLDEINKLSDDMRSDKNVTDFSSIASGYQRVRDGASLDSGQGDLAVVYGYMKMLDPTSVVREGEFATAEQTAGIPSWITAQYNKAVNGERLDEKTRSGFKDASSKLYDTAKSNYDKTYSYYERRAIMSGLDPDMVLYYNRTGETDSTPGTATSSFIEVDRSYSSVNSLLTEMPEAASAIDSLRQSDWTDEEILQAIEQNGGIGSKSTSFSSVGADTNQGASVLSNVLTYENGSKGGQCGRFVNENAGTHMGDSYETKMAYVNVPSVRAPSSGDIFVMPYKETGHTGFVIGAERLEDGSYDVTVKDSNWSLDGKVKTHVINSSKISGYARIS